MLDMDYYSSLKSDVKKRYDQKLNVIGGIDPYKIVQWDEFNNDGDICKISYPDIVMYMTMSKSSYTMDQLKAYKSMESYNYFLNGWVREAKFKWINEHCVITAKVLHSQKIREKPLNPWIIAKRSGCIISAHCDCMAGLGECCSHIGACLFFVDAHVRIQETKSCTGEKCAWLMPSQIKAKTCHKKIQDLNFTSSKSQKRQFDLSFDNTKSMPDFGKELPVLISDFAAKTSTEEIGNSLADKCNRIKNKLYVTKSQSKYAEAVSHKQSKSKIWMKLRAGRIGASNAFNSVNTSLNNPSVSLIKKICYPSAFTFTTLATQWGCNNEQAALDQYVNLMSKKHKNFQWKKNGVFVSTEYPYLAATPDALVNCTCCGKGIVEIKCPYKFQNSKILQIAEDASSCLMIFDNKIHLKSRHSYFYQVQQQLLICEEENGRKYADFIVWTTEDIFIERIRKDDVLCNKMITQLSSFFEKVILPEILEKKFTEA